MYEPIQKTSAVSLVKQWVGQFQMTEGPDGLKMVVPAPVQQAMLGNLVFPDRLEQWLVGLRLLRNIPLCYLVPDAALLPPESIRFFHVDQTWTDRVIDGVFSSANTGTVDATFTYSMLGAIRKALDDRIANIAKESGDNSGWKPGTQPITGMLMRSAIVRRWPDMIVRAYRDAAGNQTAGILRAEAISRDIYIALFAGQPTLLKIREPHVGVRFGVEKNQGGGFQVDKRDVQGNDTNLKVTLTVSATHKRLNAADLQTKVGGGSRMVAIHLEQRPYVQLFRNTVSEDRGSRSPLSVGAIQLANGRTLKMDKYVARFNEAMKMEKP